MSIDNWDNLTPAERDVLVMTNVMGWHKPEVREKPNRDMIWIKKDPDGMDGWLCAHCEYCIGNRRDGKHRWIWSFEPTRKIAAAMEVVDKMTADLWQYYFEGHATWHKAVFWKDADDGKEVRRLEAGAHGQHRCDNICLAALKAKETNK